MFESLSSKGPKLVYTHTRQTLPERKLGEKTSSTPVSVGLPNFTQTQSRAIPRPSVTVAAQTRTPSETKYPQPESWELGASSSPGSVSIVTSVSRNSTPSKIAISGQQNAMRSNSYYQHSEPDQAQVFENYVYTHSGANGTLHNHTDAANKNDTKNTVTVNIKRVDSLDNNNNTDSSSADYDTIPYTSVPDSFNSSGYHGGYRVYQGKVYEITREIPIILADSNLPARFSLTKKANKTPNLNGKTTHSSTATASIIKTGSDTNGHISHTNSPLTDITQQQPRSLPSPKLNGNTPNGVLHASALASPYLNSQSRYDQAQSLQHNHSVFKEHLRPQDDLRLPGGPERLTYANGDQSMRRPNTVGGKKSIRDLSPQAWTVREWAGPVSSPVSVRSPPRRSSSQHSASGTKTIPLKGNGDHIWTVVTKSPPQSPRQRRSSSTGQKVVTRASYRLDPNLSAKLQNSSPASMQPTKSILKTNSSPATSSNKTEQYDNHPNPSDRSRSTSPSHLLSRPGARLAYRDFDFSSLPPQQPLATLAKISKHSFQQTNSIPIHHHRDKSSAAPSSTSRRPATACAALQKNDDTLSKGSQPQKKSVTFNSQVRLHVDNNVSTIRSLAAD